jgi:GNAT superfamily N-acetyltransferase
MRDGTHHCDESKLEPMSEFHYRPYDPERDRDAARRIWREVGWLEKGEEEAASRFIEATRSWVVDVNEEAECLVLVSPGEIRYRDEDLPLAAITGVTTSRVARKQGLAARLTAHALSHAAEEGAWVAGLGMFEQGFYNQLGFGTASYQRWISFDPARINVKTQARVPRRLSAEEWQPAHRARLSRYRTHGGCNVFPAELTMLDMLDENAFGLGYFDEAVSELTHGIWFEAQHRESGPYNVRLFLYHTPEQLLELMALLRTLGDQVRSVGMQEPPDVMIQDLLLQPFKERQVTRKSDHESRMTAQAYMQFRILDLKGCLSRTHLPWGETHFHLKLRDPIESYLNPQREWRGLSGDYTVTLGPESSTEPGCDLTLPTLEASVGAFTRLWLGVLPATSLSITDELSGPPSLLKALDELIRLPAVQPDWDF